jgi:hypothetical protein
MKARAMRVAGGSTVASWLSRRRRRHDRLPEAAEPRCCRRQPNRGGLPEGARTGVVEAAVGYQEQPGVAAGGSGTTLAAGGSGTTLLPEAAEPESRCAGGWTGLGRFNHQRCEEVPVGLEGYRGRRGGYVLVLWAREAVVVAERASLVLVVEQAALAQYGDYVVGEQLQAGRQRRGHNVETVSRAAAEPVLDRVRNLLGSTGEGPVATPAAEPRDELAHRQVLAPR